MSSCAREQHTPVLQMHTFGTFSLSWDGRRIDVLSRAGSAQDVMLMQLLLHHRREGISREQLVDALFVNRDLQDVAHSLQVRIYNLKAKLKSAGLPSVNYILNRKGVFFWTEEIPVEEDAEIFESLCREADALPDGDRKLELLLRACALYTGEFLYLQADQLWVIQEARRYEELFDRCVNDGARLLREKRDWRRLLLLGAQAASAQPYFGWEALRMEALIALGRCEEAVEVYRQAERQYGAEMRLAPDEKMTLLLEQARMRSVLPVKALPRICRGLMEAEPPEDGAFLCPYPVFERVCRMARQLQGDAPLFLMGCALPEDGPQRAAKAMERLLQALRRALPGTAAVTAYGERQLLALLPNGSREACERIVAQVNEALTESGVTAQPVFRFTAVGEPDP